MRYNSLFDVFPAVLLAQAANSLSESSNSIARAASTIAGSQKLRPRFFEELGAGRVKLNYGPFSIPSKHDHMGMKNNNITNISLPCKDCFVTSIEMGLEFPDGTYANANTSMWMHHALLLNRHRKDATCSENWSSERVFASGNERSIADLTVNGARKAGYYIRANDTLDMVLELMNASEDPKQAVATIDWQYVPGSSKEFKPVRPVWLDITGACGMFKVASEAPVPNGSVFKLPMEPAWTGTFSGEVLWMLTHLHDGGVALETTKNGKVVCISEARYGETPGFIDPMMDHMHMHGMDHDGDPMAPVSMAHISSMRQCSLVGRTELGDKWAVNANYNMTAHPGMMGEDNQPAPVMGIAVLYIAE